MPIYVYRCPTCDTKTERRHKLAEKPEYVCEACGTPLERTVADRGGFALKGGGWFKQGYGK